jgi:hypothetical protein
MMRELGGGTMPVSSAEEVRDKGVIKEPLVSDEARSFLEGRITADEFVQRGRTRVEEDLDVTSLARGALGFIRATAALSGVGYAITALVLAVAQTSLGALSALTFSVISLAIVAVIHRRVRSGPKRGRPYVQTQGR